MRLSKIVKYWLKLVDLSPHRILKQCYYYQYNLAERNTPCWALYVKHLLSTAGFGIVWLEQQVGNKDIFLREFGIRVKDIFIQNWNTELSTITKLDVYRMYKTDFLCENYLNQIGRREYRIALTRLRCSAHKLEVEQGRRRGVPRNERHCPFCVRLCIETEFHFVLECPFYTGLRKAYIPEHFSSMPRLEKLCVLMKTEDEKVINNLSKFIYYAFRKRYKALNGM